jgi:hypothetical protein
MNIYIFSLQRNPGVVSLSFKCRANSQKMPPQVKFILERRGVDEG